MITGNWSFDMGFMGGMLFMLLVKIFWSAFEEYLEDKIHNSKQEGKK